MRLKLIATASLLLIIFVIQAQQISELKDITQTEKLFYLSMLWKEIGYNYPFFKEMEDFDLDKTYRQYIDLVLETDSLYDYYRTLQSFTAELKDCNTRIVLPPAIGNNLSYPLLMLQEMNDMIIITNIGKKYVETVPIGSRLLEIDHKEVNHYLETEVAPYISASNEDVLREKMLLMAFVGIKDSEIAIKVKKPNGDIIETEVTLSWQDDSWAEFIWQKEVIRYKWLDDDIAYIEMNRFDDDLIFRIFERILEEIKGCKGVVIDLRYNSLGAIPIAYDMLKYLSLQEKFPYPHIHSKKYIPLYRALGTPSFWYGIHANEKYLNYGLMDEWIKEEPVFYDNDPDKEKLLVPTVILIGEKTISPAEEFAMVLREYREDVKLVGINSSGKRGQGLILSLPLMGQAWISTSKDTYPDGRVLSRYGIKPDIEVRQSYEDYLNGKDTVIEEGRKALLEMINK